MAEKRLPIKLVYAREGDIRAPEPGGKQRDPIVEVTPQLRQSLRDQVMNVQLTMADWFDKNPGLPAVAKVNLREEALAKSHRPSRIFNNETCPIIGSERLGELLVRVNKVGLDRLASELINGNTNRQVHDISTINNIVPYDIEDVMPLNIRDRVQKAIIEQKEPIKVQLFSFQDTIIDRRVKSLFKSFIDKLNCNLLETVSYSQSLEIHVVNCPTIESLNALNQCRIIRRVSFFPKYFMVPLAVSAVETTLPTEHIFHPSKNIEYPIVSVFDSGILVGHPQLEPWVIARENFVPHAYSNHTHGTFVAGILTHAHIIESDYNDGLAGCKLVDICILPNSDPDNGPVDYIGELELITCLEETVAKYHQLVKVWNLSLSSDMECDPFLISDLATKLDDLSDKYGICFVLACGNYNHHPLRSWPADQDLNDRITCPADSLRGIAVGSIAGKATTDSIVPKYSPSPFSRRGPGPSFIIKPDLVHDGGNCSDRGDFSGQGVRSWAENGTIMESIGTSFSTPKVARLLAGIFASLEPLPSVNLAKALLIHSALLPGQKRRPEKDELHYYGFGMPGNLGSILTCTESAVTLIWEAHADAGTIFSIDDFPYPNCLKKNGLWVGDIWMTLVYNPILDRNAGFEYCRVNLDASLGLYKTHKNGKIEFRGQVPPEATWEDRYEKSLIRNGFKWSPIKVYRRSLRGITGDRWRLVVRPLLRSGMSMNYSQQFALIVTISDRNGKEKVYNDVVQQLNARFAIANLGIKEQVKVRLDLE